jgi:hypothetical protein
MELVNSNTIEKQYLEFLYGFNDEETKKFQEFIHNIQNNISCLAEYAEIDCDEWGNPYI